MKKIIDQFFLRKKFFLKSQGKSMEPILRSKDIVYYKKISFKQIKINDIVLIKKGNKLFTHRVIYKTKKYLISKGDNNLKADTKIYPKQIIAKAYKIKRGKETFNINNLYAFQSTVYFKEIIKIKFLLEEKGVEFLLLKGLPLHLYYEKRHPQRIYLDIDLLIQPKNLKKLKTILNKFGYKKRERRLFREKGKILDKPEISFSKIVNRFPVVFDIHLEIVFLMTQIGNLEAIYPSGMVKKITSDFMKNKRKIKISTLSFPILSKENLIIYLAIHFFHHNFYGAFRLNFLDKVIRKEKIGNKKWIKIAQKINQYRLENFSYPVFFLLKKNYQSPIPEIFFEKLSVDKKRVKKYLKINIFDGKTRLIGGINRFKNLFFLSPYPIWKKILIIFNKRVIIFIFLSLSFRIKRWLRKSTLPKIDFSRK